MIRSRLATVLLVAMTAIVFVILYGPIFVPIVSSFFAVKGGTVQWDQATLAAFAPLVDHVRAHGTADFMQIAPGLLEESLRTDAFAQLTQDDPGEGLQVGGAEVRGRLQQVARDALQRQEDRQDGEGDQQRRQGQQHRIQVVDEDRERLIDQPEGEQPPVEETVAAEDARMA